MSVQGNTSAIVATVTYVPPFKYVTSYAPAPLVTGTVTGAVAPTGSVDPSVPSSSSASDYATNYLQVHMMSSPSYRYAYLLWIILALLAIIYAVSHHFRLTKGSLGASYARWGMRRRTLGSKRPGARSTILPSNGIIVSIIIVFIAAGALCVIGPDYIAPSTSVFNLGSSRKRDLSGPDYSINKSLWTSGSRFGFIAFALCPLVVLLALKAAPFAVFSLRPFTHLFADKLAVFHRAVAWLIWGLTTIHVALWTVQLFYDKRNGNAVWFIIWLNYRFIFGCAAYAALTAVMVLSLKPIRKSRYEFFYLAHVITVFLTLACAAVHHPPLWYWMAISLGLWGLERAYRLFRTARINSRSGRRETTVVAGRPYQDTPAASEAYGMRDLKKESGFSPSTPYYTDKTLPRPPGAGAPGALTADIVDPEFGGRHSTGYYDDGSLQPLGSYDSRFSSEATYAGTRTRKANNDGYFPTQTNEPPAQDTLPPTRNSIATLPVSTPAVIPPPPPVPVGFAQAQLLPSRTIRLTIRVGRPFTWAAGQSVLLTLPELSKLQSHPFTIINNDENEIVLLVKARKGLTRKLFDLVRQRSLANVGVTSTKDKRVSLSSMRTVGAGAGPGGVHVPPIYVRARLDGPFGSAGRVRWGEHSTVLIICGGSGVSFGAAICDYVCSMMAKRASVRKFRTERVRFCWVAREYAEIAWVASQLRRCQEMVSALQLQIDIFVTNATRTIGGDEFAPPRPGFAQGAGSRRDSLDSVSSEISRDGGYDLAETLETHETGAYSDVVDLTNYEDEEDVNDPAEHQLSNQLQHQGKVRRAKSRKAGRGTSRYQQKVERSYPPQPRRSGYDEVDVERQYAAAAGGSLYDPRMSDGGAGHPLSSRSNSAQMLPLNDQPLSTRSPSHPMLSVNPDRRQSYRSLADSTYGRYDPFAAGPGSGHGYSGGGNIYRGTSPAPSMFFDDNQSIAGDSVRDLMSRQSRTQSMILLEDVGGGDPNGDDALWIDEADYAAMSILSEMARSGKPKLATVLQEEIEIAKGSLIVTTCGPITLNTVVRSLVARHISPSRLRHGDRRGHIAIYSEDYET